MQSSLTALLLSNINKFLTNYSGYPLFSFIGSFLKEVYLTNNVKKHKFSPTNVLISTIFGCVAAIAVKNNMFPNLDWAFTAFLSLACGAFGFELFIIVGNPKKWEEFAETISRIKKLLKGDKVDEPEPVKDDKVTKSGAEDKKDTTKTNKSKLSDPYDYDNLYSSIESNIHRSKRTIKVHCNTDDGKK